MKKIIFVSLFLLLLIGIYSFSQKIETASAGSKCHFVVVCPGNSNIKANVCTSDCSSSSTKQQVIDAFKSKMNCGSLSSLPSARSGWKSCDITL